MLNLSTEGKDRVVITDVRIPFWSMVWLLFKAALASIPATILLFFVGLGLMVATAMLKVGAAALLSASAEPSPTPIRSAVIEATPTPRIIREVIVATPEPTPTPEKICYENGMRIACPD